MSELKQKKDTRDQLYAKNAAALAEARAKVIIKLTFE